MNPCYGRGAAGLRAAAVFLLFIAGPVAAQASAADAAGLAAARGAAERAHLWRVGAWGAASVAAGTVLLVSSGGRDGRRAFSVQSLAWGAVNTGIAAVGLLRAAPDSALALGGALRAEAHLADILWLNLGLDAGYVAVGATLWIVAARGVPNPEAWRGHGRAVVLQGAVLLALDALVLAGSSGRFEALTRLAEGVALVPAARGAALVVGL